MAIGHPTKVLEKEIEAYLVKLVSKEGGIAYKFTSPNRRNVPDRMCVMPDGLILFIECKAPGKKATPGQLREHERLIERGQAVYVVDTYNTVKKVITIWRTIRDDCAQNH